MNNKIGWTLIVTLIGCLMVQPLVAQTYDHSLKVDNMEFHWKIERDNLAVKVSANTKGWVGVGFNPERGMKGADFIIGYVKGNRVEFSDDFGNRTTGHLEDEKGGGKNSLISSSGSESKGVTTLEFTIPLKSGEETDSVIDPAGKTILLLAYGSKDSFRMGHRYHTTINLNLKTGDYQESR